MGQILGLGITHYPNLAADLNMSWRMQKSLDDPALPAALRARENWHPTMRAQWGDDCGKAHLRLFVAPLRGKIPNKF